jgi:hypothetical protein
MRLGNFVVQILQGKELDSGYVAMKHNSKYTIRLCNLSHVRCDAEVEIDGKKVGGWRIEEHDRVVLERTSHDTGCFTFYKIGTSEAKKSEIVDSEKLGLITVLFKPEKDLGLQVRAAQEVEEWEDWGCLIAGGTGLSGKSDQKFGKVPPLENYDEEGFVQINLRLICETETDDEPRPLTPASNPVPPPVSTKVIL